jgi:methionine-rich copper-binding protein CopC
MPFVYLLLIWILSLAPTRATVTLNSFTPADDSTNVSYTSNLTLTFNTSVCAMGAYSLTIYKTSNGGSFESIPYASLTGWNSTTITVNPVNNFASNTGYYVNFPSGLFRNCSNMMSDYHGGMTGSTAWNFTSEVIPCGTLFQDPCKSPLDDATGVLPSGNLTLTFNGNLSTYMYAYVYLKKSSDGSTVESFNLNGGGNCSVSGAVVTLSPTNFLWPNTGYYVEINGASITKSGTYFNGTNSSTWNFTTGNMWWCIYTCNSSSQVRDPEFTPTDNGTDISLTTNLTMLFDGEVISISNAYANFYIKKVSDNSIVETVPMNSAKITRTTGNFIGDSDTDTRFVINPDTILSSSTQYYVSFDCDALKDSENRNFGLDSLTAWSFTTAAGEGGDSSPPTVSSFTPSDNATGISTTTNLSIEFDEAVYTDTGNVYIKKSSDNSTIETISITSGQVSGSASNTITINPNVTLANSTSYYIQIASTALADAADNYYAGIANTSTWNFTTAAGGGGGDVTAPMIVSYSPNNNAKHIERYQGLVLIFNEAIQKGSGNIYVKNYANNATVMTLDISSNRVIVSGNMLRIAMPDKAPYRTRLYLTIDAGAVKDMANNSYTGIGVNSTWGFTTVDADNNLFN